MLWINPAVLYTSCQSDHCFILLRTKKFPLTILSWRQTLVLRLICHWHEVTRPCRYILGLKLHCRHPSCKWGLDLRLIPRDLESGWLSSMTFINVHYSHHSAVKGREKGSWQDKHQLERNERGGSRKKELMDFSSEALREHIISSTQTSCQITQCVLMDIPHKFTVLSHLLIMITIFSVCVWGHWKLQRIEM